MEVEIWSPVAGYDGYEVSTHGRVRSWRPERRNSKPPGSPRLLTLSPNQNGYPRVSLRRDASVRTFAVHRLVLSAFVGPCPDGMEACHNNGIRDDCRLQNLRWDTRSNNAIDRKRHGTMPVGQRSKWAKLSDEDVEQIRANYGFIRTASLAEAFGVKCGTVARIMRGVGLPGCARHAVAPAWRTGRVFGGRLSVADVTEIRRRLLNKERAKDLAKEYGVHATTISHLKRGNTWSGMGSQP